MKKSLNAQIRECLFNKDGMKRTLVGKIVVMAAVILYIDFSIVLIMAISQTMKLQTVTFQAQVENYAKMSGETVSQWITLARTQIEGVAAKSDIVDESLSMDTRKELLAKYAADTVFSDFSVSYADGKTYNNTDISERDYFQKANSGTTWISDPVLRKTNNQITIMAGAKSTASGFDGVVYGGLSVDFMNELLENLDLGETGFGFMVNKEGTIISYPDDTLVTEMVNPIEKAAGTGEEAVSYQEIAAMLKRAISLEEGETSTGIFTSFDGVKYISAFTPISGTDGWVMGIVVGNKEVNRNCINMVYFWAFITIILLILATNALMIAATKIAYPVRVSANRLKKIAEGDLSTEIEECAVAQDESGRLITALSETREQLNNYIGDISRILDNVAHGDLTVTVDREYVGEFSTIKESLNRILTSLNRTFKEASEVSASLLSGAQQVEQASQSLANATTSQAGAVVQITASIEDIASHTDANTKDVLRANELTQNAKSEAENGNDQMKKMVVAMSEISEASENIAKITKVIDSIAFQTNILALNASVEAARAGEHGKGFAVVAEEVRNLAGKAGEASAEIAEMITNSLSKINVGSKIVEDTADDLQRIVTQIDEIAGIMNNIAIVSQNQSEAVAQVNKGITQISNDVQNNSAVSEETAASSIELANQAKALRDKIAFYVFKR